MLSLSKVEEIAFHLEAGQLSYRQIAKKLGVSRGTVSAMAQGRRIGPVGGVLPEAVEQERPDPPARCPECGYLVYLPCLACRTREYQRGRQILDRMRRRRGAASAGPSRRSVRQRRPRRRRVA